MVCLNESHLCVDSYRSVDSFSSVLAQNKCTVDVCDSYFQRTKMIGLEFRENVIATVKNCDITHCGL